MWQTLNISSGCVLSWADWGQQAGAGPVFVPSCQESDHISARSLLLCLQTRSHALNPFTPKSDQVQISPVASPVILHHTV